MMRWIWQALHCHLLAVHLSHVRKIGQIYISMGHWRIYLRDIVLIRNRQGPSFFLFGGFQFLLLGWLFTAFTACWIEVKIHVYKTKKSEMIVHRKWNLPCRMLEHSLCIALSVLPYKATASVEWCVVFVTILCKKFTDEFAIIEIPWWCPVLAVYFWSGTNLHFTANLCMTVLKYKGPQCQPQTHLKFHPFDLYSLSSLLLASYLKNLNAAFWPLLCVFIAGIRCLHMACFRSLYVECLSELS